MNLQSLRPWTLDQECKTQFPHNSELELMAAWCVWFQETAEALQDPIHLCAYVLTYGIPDDVKRFE